MGKGKSPRCPSCPWLGLRGLHGGGGVEEVGVEEVWGKGKVHGALHALGGVYGDCMEEAAQRGG